MKNFRHRLTLMDTDKSYFLISKNQCKSVSKNRGMTIKSGMNRYRGMTLVEIMVAVGITLGMLLLIGTVFKSATDASGSAMAHNELMSQVRTLTNQIEQDLSGLRPDMPMAIIFEGYRENVTPGLGDPYPPEDRDKMIRYDRICFFANGNFQPSYAFDLSGNLARIYYGQMLNSPPSGFRGRPVSPPRRILARRFKILTADTAAPTPAAWGVLGNSFTNSALYDYDFFERASAFYWKSRDVTEYATVFDQSLDNVVSFFRPVDYINVQDTIDDYLMGAPMIHPAGAPPYGEDALQRLFFLSDVTDFKIQIYLEDTSQGRWRWYPDDQDMIQAFSALGNIAAVAFYWNAPDLDPVSNNPVFIDNVAWFCDKDLGMVDFWPKAIRFTFTLYDKNRRRFGEGQTFSYIMKIPPRY